MGLLIGKLLQPVFGVSKKYVSLRQFFPDLCRNVIVTGQNF